MLNHQVQIANRNYDVACEPGQEGMLDKAAKLLDTEAQAIIAQAGRMPDTRFLLLAGLVIADQLNALRSEHRQLQKDFAKLKNMKALEGDGQGTSPLVPDFVIEDLIRIAAQIETASQALERS